MQKRYKNPSAAGSDWMTQCNGATQHVYFLRIPFHFTVYLYRGCGKGFVDFYQVQVIDRASGFPPALSLRLVGGQVAWAFSGERVQTIAYGGRDLRAQYGLDAAYAPYELAGKLIFVGKKDETAFVVYDGERLGLPFDEIFTAHCCEIGLYAPFGDEGRYGFWGRRGNRTWVVQVVVGDKPAGSR